MPNPYTLVLCVLSVLFAPLVQAATRIDKNLPYPSGKPSARQIAEQVFFVNQFHVYDRYAIIRSGNTITVIIKKPKNARPTTLTVERYKRNDWSDPDIRSREVAIFRSGKLRGTGMLIEDYEDDAKPQYYSIWLPSLRKIRRFAEPAHDDAWGGTDFTFGDVILRKPFHETHQLLGTQTFQDCLRTIPGVSVRWLHNPPAPSCKPKGKQVYKLKSTTKRRNWWYDYRISYVDTNTFADYRTEYFKRGKLVKVIDRDWISVEENSAEENSDPRALYWGYWYGKNLKTGHETWAVVPRSVNRVDDEVAKPGNFWSEKTLRKLKR
ncbi:MAG: outer membrane lipoprotein-sorting protein [Candidatus Thiosymbion ectosymbiont of Robbea hypermnestra]|nr:outer membrane lipoprotein-sorting protein [Candidatus Thiosymbion ectosymbiont of Robbea hypermnestra]